MIRVTILGEPSTKGSLRAGVSPHGKAFVKEQMGDKLRTWRERLAVAFDPIARQLGEPIVEPVAVFCHFRLKAPKKPKWAWPIAKGRNDPDKLARTVLDHLTGTILEDDSQVALLVVSKTYGTPGADLIIHSLSGLDDVGFRKDEYLHLTALLMEAALPLDVHRGEEVNPDVEGAPASEIAGGRVALPLGSP